MIAIPPKGSVTAGNGIRYDWGITTKKKVVFQSPWPDVPAILIHGPHFIYEYSVTGFSIARMDKKPIAWFASTVGIIWSIEDVRRLLEQEAKE